MAAALFSGFSGQAFSPAGDKGRFVLPPLFRSAVKDASDGRVLCLDKHPRFQCLVGFGLSRMTELETQLDREEDRAGPDFDRDTRAAQLFGFARVPFDDSGRFVLPDHLRIGHRRGVEAHLVRAREQQRPHVLDRPDPAPDGQRPRPPRGATTGMPA